MLGSASQELLIEAKKLLESIKKSEIGKVESVSEPLSPLIQSSRAEEARMISDASSVTRAEKKDSHQEEKKELGRDCFIGQGKAFHQQTRASTKKGRGRPHSRGRSVLPFQWIRFP